MPRNMSFALTIEQVRNKIKCVTRRQGWSNVKPGQKLQPIVKGMGLQKGEKVEKIGSLIEVISIRSEIIRDITLEDISLEGCRGMSVNEFVYMYCQANKVTSDQYCNRIEYRCL